MARTAAGTEVDVSCPASDLCEEAFPSGYISSLLTLEEGLGGTSYVRVEETLDCVYVGIWLSCNASDVKRPRIWCGGRDIFYKNSK